MVTNPLSVVKTLCPNGMFWHLIGINDRDFLFLKAAIHDLQIPA